MNRNPSEAIEVLPSDTNGSEAATGQIIPARRFGALDNLEPEEVTKRAVAIAKNLADIIEKCQLYSRIQGKKYVRVEGWETLGAMLGESAMERPGSVKRWADGTYIAAVDIIRNRDGKIVGGASHMCGMDEPLWAARSLYARRSMALTRATGKAFRIRHAWIIALAGYETTPAEEMPSDGGVQSFTEPKRASETKSKGKPPQEKPKEIAKDKPAESAKPPEKAESAPSIGTIQGLVTAIEEGTSTRGDLFLRIRLKGEELPFFVFDKDQFENLRAMKDKAIAIDYHESVKAGKTYREVKDWWMEESKTP